MAKPKTFRYYRKYHTLPEYPIRVQTKTRLDPREKCEGFMVEPHHLDARKPDLLGTYKGYVPRAGGDVWWIQHDDGTVGAYGVWELKEVRG